MNDPDDKNLIWSMYQSLGDGEHKFNELESHYRMLTSSWLLAMFAGVGYILTTTKGDSALNPYLVVFFISLVSAIGITLLWNIDLRVYHRLLDAFFVEGLRMEQTYSWIPKVRTRMVFSQYSAPDAVVPDGGVMKRIKLFYVAAIWICLLISSCALCAAIFDRFPGSAIAVFVLAQIGAFLWGRFVFVHTTSPTLGAWITQSKDSALVQLLERDGYVVKPPEV